MNKILRIARHGNFLIKRMLRDENKRAGYIKMFSQRPFIYYPLPFHRSAMDTSCMCSATDSSHKPGPLRF